MNDSGVGSCGSESDTSPTRAQATAVSVEMAPVVSNHTRGQDSEYETAFLPAQGSFTVCYFGAYTLDRRYTQSMLPWVMAEVRQRGAGQMVCLQVEQAVLKSRSVQSGQVLFEHRLQTMTRFAKTLRDARCFSYLTKPNVDAAFTCHVYQAEEEETVQQLFDTIRKASVTAVKIRSQSQSSEDLTSTPNHFFEVLYVGKCVVSAKKAPPTFIDDAVSKFDEYEKVQHQEKEEAEQRIRHKSDTSVESLPLNLEKIAVRENELRLQLSKDPGSSTEGTLSSGSEEAFSESNENISSPSGSSLLATSYSRDDVSTVLYPDRVSDPLGTTSDAIPSDDKNSQPNAIPDEAGVEAGKRRRRDGQENLLRQNIQSQNPTIRTMLIQIGHHELSLISLDRKSTIFERQFKDISFCSQGISHPEHFGFISRAPETGNFTCYVFRCASESVVEEVMLTLKQAFQSAFEQSAKNLIICELCPMHQLHRLCHDMDRMSTEQMYNTLQQRIAQLSEHDQNEITLQIKQSSPPSLLGTVEVVMTTLLKLSEEKQRSHVHINDTGHRYVKNDFVLALESKSRPSKFESFRNMAKKSITNSIEHFLGNQGHVFKEDASVMSSSSFYQDPDVTLRKSSLKGSASPTKAGHMENWLDKDGRTMSTSTESSGKDIRQRRHSTPHNLSSPSADGSPICSPEQLPVSLSRANQPQMHTIYLARKYIPSDSPIRSMFVKVGNNIDAKRRHTAEAPRSSIMGSYSTGVGRHSAISNHRQSWRLSILNRVSLSSQNESLDFTDGDVSDQSGNLASAAKERIKTLWQKAIFDTILLIRMDKENSLIEEAQKLVRSDSVESKLDYEEITPCLKEVTKVWEQMLNCEKRTKTKFSLETLTDAVKDGVPRNIRGEIWQLLLEQHRLHHHSTTQQKMADNVTVRYSDLLKQLTVHQHAILIDLGRTFPGHPYFSVQLGQGQLSLFNLLKAYSLLDQEVGYCQGLSFVAGVLLMHMPEEKAFESLKYLMFNLGFRRQYRPDMVPLQIQMYQLSRLLHDLHRDLYDHFEMYEIAPTLYAAPWFLTVFASQFPLGFVCRVFDLVFLQGTDIVLKVALVLLGNHKELVKQCDSFESVVEFLKTTLPEMGIIQMERIINQVFMTDISKQLEAYEVEYHVLQEEMMSLRTGSANSVDSNGDRIARLQVANDGLRRQKMELLEQLQVCRRQIHELEDQNNFLLAGKHKLESQNRALELERKALLNAITKFRQFVPEDILSSDEFGILASLHSQPAGSDVDAEHVGDTG